MRKVQHFRVAAPVEMQRVQHFRWAPGLGGTPAWDVELQRVPRLRVAAPPCECEKYSVCAFLRPSARPSSSSSKAKSTARSLAPSLVTVRCPLCVPKAAPTLGTKRGDRASIGIDWRQSNDKHPSPTEAGQLALSVTGSQQKRKI